MHCEYCVCKKVCMTTYGEMCNCCKLRTNCDQIERCHFIQLRDNNVINAVLNL